MRALMSLTIATLLFGTGAKAEVVTRCDRPTGQTVALKGGAITWEADGISEGSITVSIDAKGMYDVEIQGAYNSFTARGDGASIFADPGPEANLTLVVRYPLGTVETYVLSLDEAGMGSLIWSMMKNQVSGVTKGSVFTASCRKP